MTWPFFTYHPPPTGLPYQIASPAHMGLNLLRYAAAPAPVHLGNLQNFYWNNAFPVGPPNQAQTSIDTAWHSRAQHQPYTHQQPIQLTNLHTGSVYNPSSQQPVPQPNKYLKVTTWSTVPKVPPGSRQTQPTVISEQEIQSKSRNQFPNNKPTYHSESNKVQKRYSISPKLDNDEPIIKKPCIVNHNNLNIKCPIAKEQTSILSDEEHSDNNLDTRTSF